MRGKLRFWGVLDSPLAVVLIMAGIAGMTVAVGMAESARSAAAGSWEKYVAADKSFAFYYPAGWKAKSEQSTVSCKDDQTNEEITIMALLNKDKKNAEQVAQQVIGLLQQQLPSLKAAKLRNSDSEGATSVLMDIHGEQDNQEFHGMAIVITKADVAFWFSYSCPAASYAQERSTAILQGVAGSIASGVQATAPTTIIPAFSQSAGSDQPAAAQPQTAPASQSQAAPAAQQQKGAVAAGSETPNKWFTAENKKMRGYYGGALISEELVSSSKLQTAYETNSVTAASTGGDFRIAFYEDGTARVRYMVLNMMLNMSYYVEFLYEGTYSLTKDGKLTTSAMKLVNQPKTMLQFEKHITQMKVHGVYNQPTDHFTVDVETYNPTKNEWGKLGENKELSPPSKQQNYMSGSITGRDGSTIMGVTGKSE